MIPFTIQITKSSVGSLLLGKSSGASVVNLKSLLIAFIAGRHLLAILTLSGKFSASSSSS